ncbi:MAG: sulfatase-like hydrolase/transferase [Spirochaetales bacterium]|nr:sulfatase-like hydrolase/transferase [Spirochaetales bacterium]
MTAGKRNVILIFTDELRADALGCFGNAVVQTPNIDRLSAEGVTYRDCMVTQATCTPSRASILTGVYPSALKSRMVGCNTPDDERFLPRVFRNTGYHTASIGKIHLVPQKDECAVVESTRTGDEYDYYGFRHVDLVDGHGDRCHGNLYSPWVEDTVPGYREKRAGKKQTRGGAGLHKRIRKWDYPAEVHSSNYIGARVTEFLKKSALKPEPFFLHVSFPDPHHPFTVPEPYASMYAVEDLPGPIPSVMESENCPELHKSIFHGGGMPHDRVTGTPSDNYAAYSEDDWKEVKAIYYGMISLVDYNVGRILNALENTGQAGNTLVVFVSDHGDYLGDHGLLGKGLHYDSSIRTPLIYRGPGVSKNLSINSIGSTIDITPTVLDWAGVEEPEALQGISQLAALNGEGSTHRSAALTENDDDLGSLKMRTVTTAEWKMVRYAGSEENELYNRIDDPDEMRNLWGDTAYAPVVSELNEILIEELMCSFDQANGRVQNPKPDIVKWVPKRFDMRSTP